MMWWAVWCAAVVVASGVVAAPSADSLPPLDLQQIDPPAPDDDGYAVSQMGGRYANAPWLYLVAEAPHDAQSSGLIDIVKQARTRRGLSVNPAVELLQRSAYSSFIDKLAHNNRNFLDCIGKRDPWSSSNCRMNH